VQPANMPSSVAEFKALAGRIITLPHSHLAVGVRMISCAAFFGLGELPMPISAEESQAQGNGHAPQSTGLRTLELNQAYADRAIVMAAVSPPFSHKPEDRDRDDVVHVEDLSFPDRLFLGNAILEMIGLNMEWAAQVQSFRADPVSAPGESPSGAVSQAAS
jgi:hypothetical protein